MKHYYCATYKDITIRPLHRYDIDILRKWRNDRVTSKFLTPINEITEKQQERWYESYLDDKGIMFFSIMCNQVSPVGTIALYDLNRNDCSIGKIIVGDNRFHGRNVGRISFILAMSVAKGFLNIEKFKLTVSCDNKPAYHIYNRLGFKPNGNSRNVNDIEEIEMEVSVSDLYKKNAELVDVILYEEDEMMTRKLTRSTV